MEEFAKAYKVVTKTLDTVTLRVVKYMKDHGITVSAAESCTGGLVCESITNVPGASEIFLGGVVSYSESVKVSILGVSEKTLLEKSVYSPQVASQMSKGVMRATGSDASVGITGIAGPGNGPKGEPVGTVYVSARFKDKEKCRDLALYKEYEKLDRKTVRYLAAAGALEMLLDLMRENEGE